MDGSQYFNPRNPPPTQPRRDPPPRDSQPPWFPPRPELIFPHDSPPGVPPSPSFFNQPPPNFTPDQFPHPPPNPAFRQRAPLDFNATNQRLRFGGPDGGVRQPRGPGYLSHAPNISRPPNFAIPPPNHVGNLEKKSSFPPVEQSTSSKVEMYHNQLKQLLQELEHGKKVSENNDDQAWVNGFMNCRNRDHGRGKSQKVAGHLTVPEYRSLLRQSLLLQHELQELHIEMSWQKEEMEEGCWQTKLNRIKEIKMNLQFLKETLSDKDMLAYMSKRLRLIQCKRRRMARVNVERRLEEKKREDRIQELHDKLDKWQEQQTEKLEQIKKEKEMKATADSTLGEVRRKLAEVKKNQQVLEALEKLRQIRKENHSKQGLYTRLDEDKAFDERVSLLRSVLAQRTSEYEAEEKTLQVMLATEQEETKEKERERKHELYIKEVETCQQQTMEYLFGQDDPVKPDDALYPFRQFYDGACNSLNGLVSIRHDWDVHLVADDDRDGSSLPTGWVTPSLPASKTWASALLPPTSDGT